jgi:hypothetical protein
VPSSADFSSDDILDEIISLTVELEEQYRQAFFRSIEEAVADPALIDLIQDISDGTVIGLTPQVEDVLQNLNVPVSDLIDALRETMARVGQVTADTVGLEISFDMTNPRAVQYAETLGARTITASAAVKESIREIIKEVVEGELSIQNAQRLIKERAGLLPKHAQAVARYYDNLVASGSTARRARELANQYANRLLNYRVDMIARTEIGAAQSYGQLELWQQARDRGLIPLDAMRVWMTAKDELVCDVCGPMNGEVAPIDGVWFTPNGPVHYPTEIHPNCRCASGLVFSRGRAREFLNKSIDLGYERWLLEKHLGTQHDQKTHGRRKTAWNVQGIVLGTDAFVGAQSAHERLRKYKKGGGYEGGLKDNIARTIGETLVEEFDGDNLKETMRLLGVSGHRRARKYDPALATVQINDDAFEQFMRGLVGQEEVVTEELVREYFGSNVDFVMLRDALETDSVDPEARVSLRVSGLREETDPNTGRTKMVADLVSDSITSEAYRAGRSGEYLTTTLEVTPRSRDDLGSVVTDGESLYWELAMRFQERAANELARMAKGEDSTRLLSSASVMSGVAFGLRRTEAGKLELATVSSTSDPSYVSGSRSTAVENMMDLGVIEMGDDDGYAVADGLVGAWASSSASPTSQLLQDQVSQMFGLSDTGLQTSPSTERSRSNILDSTYYNSRTKPVIRRVAELMYENTQALLAETSGDDIILYRGINSPEVRDKAKATQGEKEWGSANVEQLPLSSWSGSYDTARQFAVPNRGVAGVVMATVIPKSRIFATPFTGLGCYAEAEFVVLGSESDPAVIFLDPGVNRFDRELISAIGTAEPVMDELKIKKAAEGNINIDADIRNADWVKRTFDFPEVTTAKKYREEFGLEDDEALDEHIKEWKDTPYWEGIPSKIKTALLKARLSKHLGSQHDQKAHGRRKSSGYTVGREAPTGHTDEYKARWAEAWDYLQKEKPPWWREPELGEDGLPMPRGQYGFDYEYPNISDLLGEVPGDGVVLAINREYNAQSKQMILRAISLGEITPAEAKKRYKYEAEPSGGGEEWEPLPPELYHATPYVSVIQESGGLKTRKEVEGTGLGGGPSDAISLTSDRKVAEAITRSLKEAHYAVNLSNSDALVNTKRASGSYWPEVEKIAREVYGISGEPKTAEERFDLYRSYASMREVYEGELYPLFFGVEAETIASYDPSDIGYVVVRPSVEGAQGWRVSSLGEWRVPTGDALDFVDTIVSKHLGNQHDQKSHGSWAGTSYTDIPELDRVVDEFLKTKGDWTTNDCPIGQYTAADMAGACQSISEQFVGFATSRLPEGFKVYATQTNIDEMGYTPTGDPAGEIADEDGNIVPGFYYDHTVNEVYVPDRRFPITIDFSARQYGYDTQVLIQKHLGSQHDQMTHGRRKTAARWTQAELDAGEVSLYPENYRSIADRHKHAKSAVQRLSSREGVPDLEASVAELRELNNRTPYGSTWITHWDDTGTAEEQLEAFLGQMMSDWSDTGSKPFFETLAAEALEDWYGLDLGTRWYSEDFKEDADYTLNTMSDDLRLFMKHLAASVYDVTQDHLAELGVERVRLWRGMMAEKQSVPSSVRTVLDRDNEGVTAVQADVAESPLSSWTTNLYQAQRFAKQDMLSTTDVKWYDAYSLILHDLVPAKYIYSVGGPSFGEKREGEVVVVGSSHKVDVFGAYGVRNSLFGNAADALLTGRNTSEESGVGKAEEVILVDKDERNRNWLRSS